MEVDTERGKTRTPASSGQALMLTHFQPLYPGFAVVGYFATIRYLSR